MAISFQPTEDQSLIAETVGDFSQDLLRPKMREFEKLGGVPVSLRNSFSDIGLQRLLFPESLGGMSGGDQLSVIINEKLAWGDPGASIALQGWDTTCLLLSEMASPEQQDQLLKGATPENWSAVALSEPIHLSQTNRFSTVAVETEDGFEITGEKDFVLQGCGAELLLIFAQTGDSGFDNAAVFAIDTNSPGLKIENTATNTGLLAAPTAKVTLDRVSVPRKRMLVTGSDYETGFIRFISRSALHNAARCVGVMEAAYEYARDYAAEREAFGKPIAHFQAIAFMLSDMLIATDAAKLAVWQAASAFDAGSKYALRDTSAAIALSYEHVIKVTEDAVQILGGAGYMEDHPCEKWMRDARSLSLVYGTQAQADRALGYYFLEDQNDIHLTELSPLGPCQPVAT